MISNPPIKPRFIKTALWWNGNTWKIIVVGIRNNNKKVAPNFWFSPKIKKPEPKVRQIIAPIKRIEAIGSGIPFYEIYSTVLLKPNILPGMADINIDEIATLAMKSKKALVDLFLKVISLIMISKISGYIINLLLLFNSVNNNL